MPREIVTNWGNYPSVEADITEVSSVGEIADLIRRAPTIIARGNGRCYGDSSLNDNIVSTLKLNKFLAFNKTDGELECESGVLLSEILDVIIPAGFFLPVTPGTKFITVGGAIAADVHGKNHHKDGTFGQHVLHFDLMTDSGEIVRCSREKNAELFKRTCGGMGLTGVIVSARFNLRKIETGYVRQHSKKARDLDSLMRSFEEPSQATYSVAWLDCFASPSHLGRSIFITGEHCALSELPTRSRIHPLKQAPNPFISVPLYMPSVGLNVASVKLFNFLYYHRQRGMDVESIQHFDKYFYPLDGLANWNRLYGRRGIVQYQFVLPKETSYEGLNKILLVISRSGHGSPLAVLKLFGPENPNSVMSFPMEGYTLALDFKVSASVLRLLQDLDELVLKYGGRIYLAKDARMSDRTFRETYKKRVSSGRFRSLQSARLNY